MPNATKTDSTKQNSCPKLNHQSKTINTSMNQIRKKELEKEELHNDLDTLEKENLIALKSLLKIINQLNAKKLREVELRSALTKERKFKKSLEDKTTRLEIEEIESTCRKNNLKDKLSLIEQENKELLNSKYMIDLRLEVITKIVNKIKIEISLLRDQITVIALVN